MSDTSGRLTQDEVNKALAYINTKFPHGIVCPMCHNQSTVLGAHLVTAVPYSNITGVVASPPIVYPQIFVTCKVCTHMMFFSAVMMGIGVANG